MKFLTSLVLSLFLVSACSCSSAIPNRVSYVDNLQFVRGLQDATVALLHGDDIECSGVFISDNEVLTAAHCMRTAAHMSLGVEDGHLVIVSTPAIEAVTVLVVTRSEYNQDVEHPSQHAHMFNVVYRNNDKDLVLLRADGVYESAHASLHPPTATTQEHITIGESVYAIGHPAGIAWNISQGFISRDPLVFEGVEMLIANAQIFFGNSGGPLADSQGNLVGIASRMPGSPGAGAATFVGMFISPNEIVHFLQLAREAQAAALNQQ